ncbi:MAG: S8 family peptidase [Candidatus Paceibacterota bacterium]
MKISNKLTIGLILAVFVLLTPFANASAEEGRYFIKSTKGFWKNALGVRHNFEKGFSAELSDFQVRLTKMFGVEIEPISILQISPDDSQPVIEKKPTETGKAEPAKGNSQRYLPSDQTPWGIETVYNDPLVLATSGGKGIRVAVLDTGVTISHPDLEGRVSDCKDFTNRRFPIIDGKCADKNGHGTHVAGIIAADAGSDNLGVYGVAPESELLAYKVCGDNGSCYADDVAFALRSAADHGANIVNMSFGTNKDVALIRDAINYAASQGVLMVAAAGNDGPFPASLDYPAAYPSVIAVGAISQSLAVTDWSSRGINSTTKPFIVEEKDIEFAMPGEHVESTWNSGSYVILSGTSMAAPFTAGLAAKFWQADAENPMESTRELLHSLARDLFPAGDDDLSGFGLMRVQ